MKKLFLLSVAFATVFTFNSKAQTSLNFNGIDNGSTGSYVDAGSVSLTSYTKEAWIKWDGTPNLQHNIISGGINISNHAFWIVGDKLRAGHAAGGYINVTDPGLILPNVWYHCAVTYDGVTGEMTLYKNGIQVAQTTIATGFVLEDIIIGAFENSSGNKVAVLAGQIDDVRIWDGVRTGPEILADMNNCLTGTETGLEAFYKFEDGTGSSTLTDSTGNGNDGTLVNFNTATDWVTGQGICEAIPPTATVVLDDSNLIAGETTTVTMTFSEVVTGFDNSDLTIANGTLTPVTSSDGGTTYTAIFTPTEDIEDATNIITLDNTGVIDASNNPGVGTTDSANYTIETLVPSATIVLDDSDLIAGETTLVTITFSEAVTGFDNTDLTIPNGTLSAVSSADGGITFTGTLTPLVDVEDATNVITLDNTGVLDIAGNSGVGTTDSANFTIDTLLPTATIVLDDSALAAGEVTLVTVTFSEAVTGFDNMDLTIPNGTLTTVSSSDGGITYTATYTPTIDIEDATNIITLDNTGTQDLVGNLGIGTTDSANFTIDTLLPTIVSIALDDTALLAGETAILTVTFSEAVTGFDNSDLTIPNGTLTAVNSSDGGITYTATYTPSIDIEDATNIITLDNTGVTDLATNAAIGSTDTANFTIDTDSPTETITSSESSPTNSSPFSITVTFDQTVTGFEINDLVLSNATASGFSQLGETYLVVITPIADGIVTVDIPADSAFDASGNGNIAATQFSIDYDGTAPSVVLSSTETSPTANSSFFVNVNFSEDVTDFTQSDVTVTNGTITGFIGSGDEYLVAISATSEGPVLINIADDVATDASGNGNTEATEFIMVYDITDPTIEILNVATDVNAPFVATFEFNEDVVGFDLGDIAVGNATTSDFITIDANTYTALITPIAEGPVTIDVAATIATDNAGNDNEAAVQVTTNYDITDPTVVISSLESSPTNSNPILVTITFSEDVTGFDASDLVIGNGTSGTFTAVSATEYTVEVIPTATGAVTLDVAADAGADASGNGNEAATQFSIDYDGTAPTVTITSLESSPTNANPILVTITFSEDVTGFDASDLVIGNGTSGTFTAVSATEYTVEVIPTATGAVTLDVAADAGADASGNGNEAATQFSIDYDGTAPTVTITSLESSPTNANPILVTITFSEDVTGFDASDLVIGNGTSGTFTAVSATEYTVEVIPTATGAVTLDVAADAGADASGNGNEAATQFSIDYDGTAPTVTITSLESSPTNANPILVTITFSEAVTGFDASDLVIGNGTSGTFTAVSATEYTVEVIPTATGAVTLDVAADAGADASGNGNEAATQFSIDYDGTAPTVTITSLESSPTNANPILVTITFSEAVTGFDASDLVIGNGTSGTFTAVSATEYTVEVIPTATGAVTLDVAADAGADASGNGNEVATQFSIDYDGTAPTVTITSLESSPTNANPILVTITFSEAVTGFDASDLVIGNGTSGTFTAVSATEYTVEVIPTATGAVTLDVAADAGADASGNGNEAATQFSIDYDGTAPTVTITSLESSPTNANPILVTITFSEDVTGFDASDLVIGNGTSGTFTAVSATEYTVEVIPTATGAVTLDVAADAGADASGNGNEAATQFSIDYDGTAPTVTITSLESSPTNANPILVTITFSEDVTGFDASDLVIGNGTSGTFTAVSATEYTVEVIPTATGAVTLDVAADAGADASGNGNEAATQFSIDYDGTAPTVVISSLESSPTNSNPILVTITFSEDVTGFDASDLVIGNGTSGTFTAVSATEYTVEVIPTATGAVTLDVAADAGADASGNGNEAATQFSIDYDGTAPTVTITSLESSPTNANPILVTITFSEDVTGFDASDLVIGNGTSGTFTAVSATEYTVEVIPTATGAVTLDVAADAGADASGNGNEAATQFSIDYDGTAPTVTITSLESSPTNANPILVTITFSEAVTGFDASDLVIGNGTSGTFTAVSATEYTVEVIPTATGAVTLDVAADAGADASGNGNEAATQFSIDYDGTAPTVTITSLESSPTNANPILVTITFSEAVTGFDASDLVIGNGTSGTFTAVSATEYTVEVIPTATGAVTLDVAADAGADASGNGNEVATQFSIDYDGTVPTVVISSLESSPTNSNPILVTITFSEDVTGFDASDLVIGNGTSGTFTAVSATEYTVEVIPTATGAVTLDVAADAGADASGNGNEAATQFSIDYDGTAPTVTITSLESSPTNANPILVTITFSEDVTGFDASDLVIGNGTSGTFTAVSATEYTVEVIPTATGAVTLDVAADAGADASGNGNEAATQFSIDYDGTAPTVTITSLESSPTNANPILVTITFSEDVTGFDASDLVIGNGTSGTFTAVSATEYTVEVIPTATGAVTLDVAADAGADASGNGNEAATQFSIDYDGTLKLSPIVFLQGPLLNPATPGLMNDILREDNHLPTTSPYVDGLTVNANVFNSGGASGIGLASDNIVDWVWVELRDSTDNTNVIASQSALLQRDGDVVGLDGLSSLSLNAPATDYYIVVNHRNHLGVMSFNSVVLSASSTTVVDFTDSTFSTFGNNAQIVLGSGLTALWAGDVNGNGQTRYLGPNNDTNSIKDSVLDPANGNPSSSNFFLYTGYDNADLDMNGQVRYLGPGNDTNTLKDIVLLHPSNTGMSNFFPIFAQIPN